MPRKLFSLVALCGGLLSMTACAKSAQPQPHVHQAVSHRSSRHAETAKPIQKITSITLTGITYRIGKQVAFIYGSDVANIDSEAALKAYLAAGVQISEPQYFTGDRHPKLAAYRLTPTATTGPAFRANVKLTTDVPAGQHTISTATKVMLDLTAFNGLPTITPTDLDD